MTRHEFSQKPRLEREWLIYSELQSLHSKFNNIMNPIEQLTQDIQAEETIEAGLISLATGLFATIKNTVPGLTSDQITALDNLHSQVLADTANMSAAITANTPGA